MKRSHKQTGTAGRRTGSGTKTGDGCGTGKEKKPGLPHRSHMKSRIHYQSHGLGRSYRGMNDTKARALYAASTAVLTGENIEVLDDAALQLSRRGCRQLVQVLFGSTVSTESAHSWLAASYELSGDVIRIYEAEIEHAAGARAAGAACAALYDPEIVLYAESDRTAVEAAPVTAMLQAVRRHNSPTAALPDDGRSRLPFSRWDGDMVMNAFVHWSLGSERRVHVSMEQGPFALNRAARLLLDSEIIAEPAEALARLLAAGGIAIPVAVPAARTDSRSRNWRTASGLRFARAIHKATYEESGHRHRYPDLDRRREAAVQELPAHGD